jgi:hypothetical protein
MKTFFLSVFSICLFANSFAQTSKKQQDTFLVSSIYEDEKSELIISDVLHFDEKLIKSQTHDTIRLRDAITGSFVSYKKAVLMNHFDNWLNDFAKTHSVKIKKDTSHYTILYRTLFEGNEVNVLLIAEFKDEKIRLRFFDEGDVRTTDNMVPEHFNIASRFASDILLYPSQDLKNQNTQHVLALKNYKKEIDQIIVSVNFYILGNQDYILKAENQLLDFSPTFDF